jgi:type II secretory pathway pseudopilin PulG
MVGKSSARGFTYLGLLLAVAVIGIGLAVVSEVWATTAHRQRMAELEWVGNQYVQAIGSYYESSPGGTKRFPVSIDDLLEDKRVPFVKRHLRQAYANPMTGKQDWGWIAAPGGGIRGLRIHAPGAMFAYQSPAATDFVYTPLQRSSVLSR